jgi:hypothetical protein
MIDQYQPKIRGLGHHYGAIPVTRLTLTRIAFWNSGVDTILKDAVPASDPLRIVVAEGLILRARVVAQSLAANECRLDRLIGDPVAEVPLEFAFLDPGHFVVADLLHTGDDNAVRVVGTIPGASGGIRALPRSTRRALLMGAGGVVTGAVALTAWAVSSGFRTLSHRNYEMAAMIVTGLLLTWVLAGWLSGPPRTLSSVARAPVDIDGDQLEQASRRRICRALKFGAPWAAFASALVAGAWIAETILKATGKAFVPQVQIPTLSPFGVAMLVLALGLAGWRFSRG